MITKESIDNLKNHIEIVDVISQSLELKKSGANFKACCPFHGEDTPSFVVSPAKQIYHCFGCGAGGDAIKFVMEYEKLTYPEALEKLASMYNVTLTYDNTNNKPKQDLKVLESVNQYYQKLFANNKVAKDYIKSRGISEFSIEKFEIGYAPKSFETINYLKNNFLNLADAKDLGVIDSGQNGLYSRFIERITFPIYGLNGKIVGFGGRTITGHSAKYVNSPQTKLFNKSKLLYGYNIAKENIYKKNRIIVTEGYLDVIMLHQAGFNTAVATLGTALTKEHLPILRRGEPKVIVAYDGDKAGLNAAFKASVMLSQSEFEGGVVIFDEGLDPADMVKDGQIEKLNTIFTSPSSFISFAIDYIIQKYEINDPMQKQKALKEANDYLKSLSMLYQDEYKRYIAQKLNIRENLVKVTNDNSRVKFNNDATKIDIAELCIIKAILEKPSRLDLVLDLVDASMFEYHNLEFETLLEDINNPSLNAIILNERLENYDDERLERELLILLIKFYSKYLNKILYQKDIEFRKKANIIRKLKDNISQLKKGKLVSFDIDLLK
ncbi:DNA primase [Malaciobacter halophilus]|uniref:DNA primase n=1 Tax=Malaciobacter halophilus TaxID=197482 RepID=A0A2N1J527_9BACT|nr:DNA primase [Malaciobacter halophilus]AXH10326.1 DNA primase [Malaciobacter halophilus]PKI81677.1 DNA primase [Malaciobacter halophilus]